MRNKFLIARKGKNMKKFLKVFMNISLFQIISWSLLILCDYFDEKPISELSFWSSNIQSIVYILMFLFPVMITIGYLILENKLVNKIEISKKRLCIYTTGIWILETIVILMVVWTLIENDKWIIYQEGGWDNFLNGIEYLLIPFYNLAVPCIVIGLQRIICFIFKKIKKVRSNMKI